MHIYYHICDVHEQILLYMQNKLVIRPEAFTKKDTKLKLFNLFDNRNKKSSSEIKVSFSLRGAVGNVEAAIRARGDLR